jgi:hypothetical protein
MSVWIRTVDDEVSDGVGDDAVIAVAGRCLRAEGERMAWVGDGLVLLLVGKL